MSSETSAGSPAPSASRDTELATPPTPRGGMVKAMLMALVATLLLLVVFLVGMQVGYRKAAFSFRWGDNYHQMFAGPPHGFFNDFENKGFMSPHGIFGTVLKTDGNTLIIQDKDDTEKSVVTTSTTVIRENNETIQITDVTPDEKVVIIGEPDDLGQIIAKFIRVFSLHPL